MDVNKFCKKNSETFKTFGPSKYILPKQFMRYYLQATEGLDIGDVVMCMETVKRVALIRLQLSSQIATQIKRDIRVSFADTMSNFDKVSFCYNVCFFLAFLPRGHLINHYLYITMNMYHPK